MPHDDHTRSMDFRGFVSLQTKFALFFSLIIVTTCLGLTWSFLHSKRETLTTRLAELGQVLATNLAYNARFGIVTRDVTTLRQLAEGVLTVEEVAYVIISDADGNVLTLITKQPTSGRPQASSPAGRPSLPDSALAQNILANAPETLIAHRITTQRPGGAPLGLREGTSALTPPLFEEVGILDFAVPVRRVPVKELRPDRLSLELAEREQEEPQPQTGALVGLVQVGLTEAKLRQSMISVIGNFIVLTFTMILAGVLGTVYLSRRMIDPLRDLAAGARKVAEGDLDSMVTPTTRDEIGQLAGLFNVMTRSLKERDLAISTNINTIRRQIAQLTTLNQTGAAITSTLDLDKLLASILRLLIDNLGFARMLLVLYDPQRKIARIGRAAGVPEDIEALARALEIPVGDDRSFAAELLLHGKPQLILDLMQQAERIYPPMFALLRQVQVHSFVAVPLRSQQRILGFLAGDRTSTPCTTEDLDLLMTVASHVAVAIDNATAYLELELLTKTLERRVEERTKELKATNLRLQDHDRRRSKFLSVASHELRTPMTSIRGLVENMLDGLTGALTDRQAYYLRRVDHNIERLSRVVNQLLDWSRLDMGRIELKTGPVDLVALVQEVLDSFQVLIAEKTLAVRFDHPQDVPLIQADRDKLEQVLWNLVGNAVKFTPSGGEISVTLQRGDEGMVTLCVQDTGCGIAPEDLPHVFDEFSRINSSLPQSQGAQLGLYITKSLVLLHGGRVEVDSTLGKGSSFRVTLPISLSSPAVHSEQPAAGSE